MTESKCKKCGGTKPLEADMCLRCSEKTNEGEEQIWD